MSLIQINNVTFGYDGSYEFVFEGISASLDTNWKLGFVGRNGRGKTTLLRLLMGEYAYTGSIASPVAFSYFPFIVHHEENLTIEVLEEIAIGFALWELQRELSLLEVEEEALYRPYNSLSHGERTKVQLAALFLRQDTMLLIDEPTNHLDREARGMLAKYLNAKRGFILVSHDRLFLDGCVDHVLSINKSGMQVVKGNFTTWQHGREMQDAYELAQNEKRAAEVKRLSDAARKMTGWSNSLEATKIGDHAGDRGYIGHKSAKMMKRAKAVETRRQSEIEEKSKLLKDIEYNSPLILRPKQHYAQRLLVAEGLSLWYGERPIFQDICFEVTQGQRIALCGRNGSGKSSILRAIMGEPLPYAGALRLSSGLILSYVPQDTSFLFGGLTEYAREAGIDESLFKTILRKLDFRRAQFEKDMADFSAGQRKKVLIARSLCEEAHLYLWDEPLNYVDVLSRMQIEALIVQYQPTMLLVEHDGAFIDAVATSRVEL